MGSTPAQVLPFEDALLVVREHAYSLRPEAPAETVKLLEARGRVLAQPVLADRDQPPFDRSTRDGYAVRASDLSGAGALRIVGQLRAGEHWHGELAPGEALQIMTGAPVPQSADSVVMVEHVEASEGVLHIGPGRTPLAGANIVRRGSEALAGMELLPAGTAIGAAEIALAAACGYGELRVTPRPMVAIVATGDELVELDQVPGPEQIRNSNSYGIAALVAAAGAQPGRLGIARDLREEVRERILQGRMWNLLVFSGGVSMGEYDLVEEVLAEFDAEFFFTGVQMQPGKPVVFGRLPARDLGSGTSQPACYFFGLPGNPVSTQVTFHCFVEPFVRALAGEQRTAPHWALARLSEPAAGKPGLTRLLPARLDGVEVRTIDWQGSGDMAANARANCYAEISADRVPGDIIRVLLREGRA